LNTQRLNVITDSFQLLVVRISERSADASEILNKVICIKCACRFHDEETAQSCNVEFHEKVMYQRCILYTKKDVSCIAMSKLT